MSDTIFATIIGGAFGILGVWFGYWLNRNSTQKAVDLSFEKAIKLLERQDFLRASAEFRDVFFQTFSKVDPRKKLQGAIDDDITRHVLARDKFRPFLKIAKGEEAVRNFDQAWNEYAQGRYSQSKETNLTRNIYNPEMDTKEEWERLANLAKERIHKLLEFTR